MTYNPQAIELNSTIEEKNPAVMRLLSEKGKAAFFPAKGILGQAAEAANCDINATIGIALEEDTSTTCLESISSKVSLSPKETFQYAPSFGIPALRQRWKEMLTEKNPTLKGKNVSTPVVTNALTHGIYTIAQLFVNSGDNVITPGYFWGNYKLILENGSGAVIKNYETFANGGYNIAALEAAINEGGIGKKIIILNFPNNPTGYTPTNEEAVEIKEMLVAQAEKGNEITVIIDDAYFGLVYKEGVFMESLFALLCDAHENILAVKADGPTKEDYVWGFRVGFVTFGIKGGDETLYKTLEAKAASIVRGSISNAPALSQNLLLQAYNSDTYSAEKQEKYNLLKKRFEEVERVLATHREYAEEFTALPYNSGYFMCIKPRTGIDAEELRTLLVSKYSIGLITLNGLIRIAFSCTPTDKLESVFEGIYKACKEL